MSRERHRLFVYGTLLRGEPNNGLLRSARLVGSGRTEAAFGLADLGAYPALLAGGRAEVVGEVYEVDEATLADLDRLEGHPAYYQRVEIELADGTRVETYVMEAARVDGCPRIELGDWRAHRRERRCEFGF